jgi:hypothetical protein
VDTPGEMIEFEATGMTYMPRWSRNASRINWCEPSWENPYSVGLAFVRGNPHNAHAIAVTHGSLSIPSVTWADHTGWRDQQIGWVPDEMCDEVHDKLVGPDQTLCDHEAFIVEFDPTRKPRPLVRIVLAL